MQKVGTEPLKWVSRYEASNIAENKVFTGFEGVIVDRDDKVLKFFNDQ